MITRRSFTVPLHRRSVLAGLAGSVLVAAQGRAQQIASPRPAIPLTLRTRPVRRPLRPGGPDSEIWALEPETGGQLAFRRGDTVALTFQNDLPVPAILNWYGLDGVPTAEPLLAGVPIAPGSRGMLTLPLLHAGTLLCDARLLGDGQARATSMLALKVGEDGMTADRDEVFLIEDWRLRADGSTAAPGMPAEGTAPIYTINGQPSQDIPLRPNERVRFRFINACQRNVAAVKIENHDVRVMAIDGRPAEPFAARDGQLMLAPGTRIDAIIDATGAPGSSAQILLHDGSSTLPIARLTTSGEPVRKTPIPPPSALPSDGLPDKIDLRNALRVDLALNRGAAAADGWSTPAQFDLATASAFRVKRNRAVVLALTNRATVPVTFRLHGHHFRLLDRLDDGWKPFWLDTLVVGPNQTHRVAFKAETAGRWLLESMAADWSAPRLVRHYLVE
ncbi:MAG: multicopper oxidase domain-containing protein [Rhizobiales bacterium]|nr:multicopper oxidase domain-containing protein [Hyphomicrobiales bacterium]